MKLRGFEKITSFKEVEFPMPERKTKMAAGYDICLPQDVTIKAHTLQMVPTGVKATCRTTSSWACISAAAWR